MIHIYMNIHQIVTVLRVTVQRSDKTSIYNISSSDLNIRTENPNLGLTFLKLLILVFHFTLVIHIFCPLNL